MGGEVFYSQEYLRAKVRNSYTIAYSDGRNKSYGLIKLFLSLPAFTVAVLAPLVATARHCYPGNLKNCITPVQIEPDIAVVPTNCIVCKCVFIDLSNGMYVCTPPNSLHID